MPNLDKDRPEKVESQSRLSRWLAMFLPGVFLLGFNIGTGSVTAMAKAGAHYGMSLLWTIVASCLETFVLINAYGRYTLVTGETALQAMRKHLHPGIAIFFIVALTAGVSGSVMGVMGVMGIVADISFEWSKMLVAGGIPSKYFAGFFIALVLVTHVLTLFTPSPREFGRRFKSGKIYSLRIHEERGSQFLCFSL